jgi:hypothetical protein
MTADDGTPTMSEADKLFKVKTSSDVISGVFNENLGPSSFFRKWVRGKVSTMNRKVCCSNLHSFYGFMVNTYRL